MIQKLKKKLKEQKGFTLIELLAVIVILGIIAAIAIPSILNLIDNSKKDAHLANADQLVSAARTAVAQNDAIANDNILTLNELKTAGFIESIKNPDGGLYSDDNTKVVVNKSATPYTYTVTLNNGTKDVLSGNSTSLTRSLVTR